MDLSNSIRAIRKTCKLHASSKKQGYIRVSYTISFMSYYIYDENKDLVGINIISIFDENSYTEEKPYIPSNIYRIGGE